mgnify:CR=1 FL=1
MRASSKAVLMPGKAESDSRAREVASQGTPAFSAVDLKTWEGNGESG